MKTIYEKATVKMHPNEVSNHESDLYIKKTPISDALVEKYDFKSIVKIFHCQENGELWYDIPFAFDPFWNKLNKK